MNSKQHAYLLMSILFCLIIPGNVLSEESLDPNSKHLKTLPPVNEETKQWFISSQNGTWGGWKSYTLKEYVLYPFQFNDKMRFYFIELFENKDLTGNKLVIREGGNDKYRHQRVMLIPGGKVCIYLPTSKYEMTKKWINCVNNKCEEFSVEEPKKIKLRDGKNFNWYEYSQDDATEEMKLCKQANGGFEFVGGTEFGEGEPKTLDDKYNTYVFIPMKTHPKNGLPDGVAELDFDGKSYYLDIRTEHELYFGKTKKTLSAYEKDWIRLQTEYEKIKANIGKYFDRIKKEGVKAEFVTDAQKSDFESDTPGLYFKEKPKSFTANFVNEVKACAEKKEITGMDYLRGILFFKGDKKVCSVEMSGPNHFAIMWVDYPEAFMNHLETVIRIP